MRKFSLKKVLFGLSVSLVLAMAIGSFALSETEANMQVETKSVAATNADTGDFVVDGDASEYSFHIDTGSGLLFIHGTHKISMAPTATLPTDQTIVIDDTANITLSGVNIETSDVALQIENNATFNVTITLEGENTLTSTGQGCAGLQKADDGNVTPGNLTITGEGTLKATGGSGAAGIGGTYNRITFDGYNGSNITISGNAAVTATGGERAAGIGGGNGGSGSDIKITGGEVTATGGERAAGIGGGNGGSGSDIKITGGEVTATGGGASALGYGGAGIGGGNGGSGSDIKITGGEVTATGGGDGGAGIGGGNGGSGSDIKITGGEVTATGGERAAGIGGGNGGSGSDIKITGGEVTTTGGYHGAGIGGGGGNGTGENGNGTKITISSGIVKATGGERAAGIGGGDQGTGSDITISGGKVEAYAGDYDSNSGDSNNFLGAGIGGGYYGDGTDITISGGEVIATGKNGGAGIGGGCFGNGTDITISVGSITATGGYLELGSTKASGAGIGSGAGGTASGNKLNNNAAVLAISGEDTTAGGSPIIKPLDGFADSDKKSGLVFVGIGRYKSVGSDDPQKCTWVLDSTDWDRVEIYGDSVTITEDITFPMGFQVGSNSTLTIGKNADGKEATLSMAEGKKLTVEGSLTNNGVIDIPAENIKCNGNGKITTLLNYDPQGGSIKTNDDNYITYQDENGVKEYENLPEATKEGCDFDGWYDKAGGQGTKVEEGNSILLNEHILYANWIENPTPTPPTPTPPGPEPQPTPPGPEPGPTPEPTPDPSVDPDGDGGSSSKTSDPFMGGVALALLGVATTGAVLVRKRK